VVAAVLFLFCEQVATNARLTTIGGRGFGKGRHYTVSKVRAVIPPLGHEHDQRVDQQ
jgi:hypothetical protein